jgi:serpin B
MIGQVEGNSAFTFDLYQALRSEEGNLFYSPYSVSLALAMTYAGARGETEDQMANTLRFVLPQDRLHATFNALDWELASRGEGARGKDGEGFRLNIVNALWVQQDFEFLQGFLDLIAENYGAGLRLLDFVNAPEESRILINQWVSDQTQGRIEDLVPQGFIDDDTRLVLTNAIYFNAAWLYPFSERATKDGTFHLLDGGEVTVPMMKETAGFGYADGDGYQAVELPYDGDQLSMVIMLPDEHQFLAFESSLDAKVVGAIVEDLYRGRLALTLPKFEVQSDFGLADRLADMGMPTAFSDAADFSGISGAGDMFITDVVHQAFISIDEAGTEAAAATAVGMGLTSLPPELEINRPFVFLIRDIQTGAILFVGRVLNPIA